MVIRVGYAVLNWDSSCRSWVKQKIELFRVLIILGFMSGWVRINSNFGHFKIWIQINSMRIILGSYRFVFESNWIWVNSNLKLKFESLIFFIKQVNRFWITDFSNVFFSRISLYLSYKLVSKMTSSQ